MTHYYNSSNFNLTNLNRPYGKDASPLPWSRQNRRLKPIEDFTLEEMFEIVKHDVSFYDLNWLSYSVGQ